MEVDFQDLDFILIEMCLLFFFKIRRKRLKKRHDFNVYYSHVWAN